MPKFFFLLSRPYFFLRIHFKQHHLQGLQCSGVCCSVGLASILQQAFCVYTCDVLYIIVDNHLHLMFVLFERTKLYPNLLLESLLPSIIQWKVNSFSDQNAMNLNHQMTF